MGIFTTSCLDDLATVYVPGTPVHIVWHNSLSMEDSSIKGYLKVVEADVLLGTDNDSKEFFINKFLDEHQELVDKAIETGVKDAREKLDSAKSVSDLTIMLGLPKKNPLTVFKKSGEIALLNTKTGEKFLAVDLDYAIERGLEIKTKYVDPNSNEIPASRLPSPIKKSSKDGAHYTFPLSLLKIYSLSYEGKEYCI